MTAAELEEHWRTDLRWAGIRRPYKGGDVVRLRGSIQIEHTLARFGAERLWNLLHSEAYVPALGTLTGNQAVEQVQAGLKAIYVSGWQIAADGNLAGQMYPDQSLYPANSVPAVVRGINAALARADQIQTREGAGDAYWFAPIVADAEAGFGGPLNAFELMKWMIDAGAASVHFEDQPVAKRGSHGAALVSIAEAVEKLVAARLAADVCAVPTLLIARTDAEAARYVTGRPDERDRRFLTSEDSEGGDLGYKGGLDAAIARACAYAPYADLLWYETVRPDLAEARRFAEGVHREFPDKMLAYNCPPSFNWKRKLDEATIQNFQRELGAMGYKFQFVTLAGFHALNHSMFTLAKEYAAEGMLAYAKLQEQEFQSAKAHRFPAIKHQRFVGNGYFDDVMNTVLRGLSATGAATESGEQE
jgi:isocitrate lyase